MKSVAVLGGGPAGAHAAECLSSAGIKTILLDEKLAWEKPCGGGLTYKAYSQYPFLIENDTPKKLVTETWLEAPRAGRVRMELNQPLLIYSRFDLNNMLLRRAERAGAQVEKERVMGIERRDRGWRIRTRTASIDTDFCVVATGARNPLRDVGTTWTSADTMQALGYYVESDQPHVDIQFPRDLEGYIWVFPRCGHLSVGIAAKGEPAQKLRARLEQYMERNGLRYRGAKFYAHMLPSLASRSWRANRVSGEGWLAVGDAAGLVDPVTGEGLYYAIRSGDLAARMVVNDAFDPVAKPAAYRDVIEKDISRDLYIGSLIARRVFLGKFLFDTIPARMIHFTRRSPRFRALMQDLFAGTQNYATLRDRLFRNLNGTLQETLLSFFFSRGLPAVSKL